MGSVSAGISFIIDEAGIFSFAVFILNQYGATHHVNDVAARLISEEVKARTPNKEAFMKKWLLTSQFLPGETECFPRHPIPKHGL